MFSRYWHQ